MRASHATLVLLGALALGLPSCRDGGPGRAGPVTSRRSGAARDSYRPPVDGILTPAQVESFLKVRERTVRLLASPVKPLPSDGGDGISGATEARATEMKAARDLSVPVDEHLWVRERVLEAEAAALTAKLNEDVLALLDRTLASLRERRAEAPDEASRRILDEQIASFGAEAARVRREAEEKEPPAIRANLRVTAPYRARISTIADELAQLRPAATPAAGAPPAR